MLHLRELLSQTVQNTAEELRNKIDEKKNVPVLANGFK